MVTCQELWNVDGADSVERFEFLSNETKSEKSGHPGAEVSITINYSEAGIRGSRQQKSSRSNEDNREC